MTISNSGPSLGLTSSSESGLEYLQLPFEKYTLENPTSFGSRTAIEGAKHQSEKWSAWSANFDMLHFMTVLLHMIDCLETKSHIPSWWMFWLKCLKWTENFLFLVGFGLFGHPGSSELGQTNKMNIPNRVRVHKQLRTDPVGQHLLNWCTPSHRQETPLTRSEITVMKKNLFYYGRLKETVAFNSPAVVKPANIRDFCSRTQSRSYPTLALPTRDLNSTSDFGHSARFDSISGFWTSLHTASFQHPHLKPHYLSSPLWNWF